MKKVLTFLFSCFVAVSTWAMPARPGTFTVRQADGSVLTLQMFGDEHFHYFRNVENGDKMLCNAQGIYYKVTDDEISRLAVAGNVRRSMANELRARRMEQMQPATRTLNTLKKSGAKKLSGEFNGSLTGQRKGLVILVNFANLAHSIDNPRQAWDDAFNKEGYDKNGHVGSVHDYFYDQSYGKFDLEFDVVGPVTVSKNMEYYGKNTAYGSDQYPYKMVEEACRLVDDMVDYNDYDWDGDGEVEQVYVIYAGYGESSGAPAETIWPHEYWLHFGSGKSLETNDKANSALGKVRVDTYACSCEFRGVSGSKMNGIGTACHEFSHCIGFPDFYDTDYAESGGEGFGMDDFDVLGSGGYNGPTGSCEVPAGYTAYERWMAGWLEPMELNEGCDVAEFKPIADEPEAYIIYNQRKSDEYFLLENRQVSKWFSYCGSGQGVGYPAGHGMLVTHVDFNKSAWANNIVNSDPSHQRCTIIPANKSYGTYRNNTWTNTMTQYQAMYFPGTRKNTELTNDSHYDCGGKLFNRNSDGSYFMNRPITNIRENPSTGTISFRFNGGFDDGNRWTVTFNAGTGTIDTPSWTQSAHSESVTLPSAQSPFDDWIFLGWTTSSVEFVKDCPATLLEPGTTFMPEANVTLYAVYAHGNDGLLSDSYKYVTKVTNGCKYLFVTKNKFTDLSVYAVSSSELQLDVAQKITMGKEVKLEFADEVPYVSAPDADLVWTVSVNDDKVRLAQGHYYLNISSDGMSLTDLMTNLYWNESFGLAGEKSGAFYYVHNSSGKLSVSTNTAANNRLYAYEKSGFEGRDVTYATSPTTGNVGISGVTLGAAAGHYYDLSGRRISSPAHGVYVKDGKKIMR